MGCAQECEWKSPVRGATTGEPFKAITLSGAFTDDGISYIDEDRILVKDHPQPELNGIYRVNTNGQWSRTLDARDEFTLLPGSMVLVLEGFTNNGRSNRGLVYRLRRPAAFVLGQTPLYFILVDGNKAFSAEVFGATPLQFGSRISQATPDEAAHLQEMFDAQFCDSTGYLPEGAYAVRHHMQIPFSRKVVGRHLAVDSDGGLFSTPVRHGNTVVAVPLDVNPPGPRDNGFDHPFPDATDPVQNAVFFTFHSPVHVQDLEIWCDRRVNYGFFTGHHPGLLARFTGITVDGALLDGFRFNVCQAAEFDRLRVTNAGRHGIHAINCNALTLNKCATHGTPFGAGLYFESTFLRGDGASGGAYAIGPGIEGPQRYGIVGDSIVSKLTVERAWIEALGPDPTHPTDPTMGRHSDGIFLDRCRFADIHHSQVSNTSAAPAPFTVDVTTNVITTASPHGFVTDDVVTFTNSGGALPGGLECCAEYFVIAPTPVSFKVSFAPGGTEIDITTPGTGVHTVLDGKRNVRLRHSFGCSVERNAIANNIAGPTIRLEGISEGNVIRDNWQGSETALIPVTVESNRMRNEIKTWIEGGETVVYQAEVVGAGRLTEVRLDRDAEAGNTLPLLVSVTSGFQLNDRVRIESLASPGVFEVVTIAGTPSAAGLPVSPLLTQTFRAGDRVTVVDALNGIAGMQLEIDVANVGAASLKQTVTFPSTPFTRVSEVPTFINGNTTGLVAMLEQDRLVLRSNTIGDLSRISVSNLGAAAVLGIAQTVQRNRSKPNTLPIANWHRGDRIKNIFPGAGDPVEWVYVENAVNGNGLADDVVVPTAFAYIQQRTIAAATADVTASTLWITDPALSTIAFLDGGHDGQVITIESRRRDPHFCRIESKDVHAGGNMVLAYKSDLFLEAGESVRLQRRSLNTSGSPVVEWVQVGMSGRARAGLEGGPGLMHWLDALNLRNRLLGNFERDAFSLTNTVLNFATSLHRKVTLAGDTTLSPSGLSAGEPGVVLLTQDGSGQHQVQWSAGAVNFHGTNGQPNPAPNSTTEFLVFLDGTTLHVLGIGNTVVADAILEKTANAGVMIEGLLIRNNRLDPEKYRRRECGWHKETADAAPAAATGERCFFRGEDPATITGVFFCPDSALDADNTDNATMTVRKRDGQGGAPATVAAFTTDTTTGGLSAFEPKSFGALANQSLAAGNVLTLEIAKSGAGVIVPSGKLIVHFTVD